MDQQETNNQGLLHAVEKLRTMNIKKSEFLINLVAIPAPSNGNGKLKAEIFINAQI